MSQERTTPPPGAASSPIDTLAALLRVRQDLHRGRLFLHFGDPLIERLAGYIEGYRACMRENGLPDVGYEHFRRWLRKVKQEPPVEEEPTRYLRDCPGDPEQAIRNYLDLVAEFAASHPGEPIRIRGMESNSAAGRAHGKGILPYLLRVRQDLQQGGVHPHMGEVSAERLNAFVDGYNACLEFNGFSSEEYVHFRDWLRDVKQELPGEGWPAGYLRDCQGDHDQAIRKYLDFVAEFVGSSPS
ncbi:MAG TPA: hypothetical protein VLQ93_22945 [Myxococcaceae bacterium]|nr:hypothetical protein [Myxococcaceae bacterium]